MTTSAAKLKQKEMIASLRSNDPSIVNQALSNIKKLGTSALLPEIIEVYVSSNDPQVTEGIESILFQLKEAKAIDYLMDALHNKSYKDQHRVIAAAIWESGLDAAPHLRSLVEIASDTDYMTCLEILTIIENIEEGIIESDVEYCIGAISEQLQWKKSENDALLASIAQVLQESLID